ncbi:hypothetical protein SAY86_012425 [Trapa natans]|uniref:Cupin type-1 domain-containing protein n=1 Tax=Trapa natans TaxID=22666 RepID=A0AAN7RBK4_TRANT|nr:hypothetical protein SAY86_012425 [Trapa natans]
MVANHPPPRLLMLSLATSYLVVVNGFLVVAAAEEASSATTSDSVLGIRHKGFRGERELDDCQVSRLNSLEPTNRIQCEAGTIESWDPNEDEFQCVGVAVVRYIIESNGLLLPSYANAPQLIYIVEGGGIQGVVLPGCPETFQSSQQQSQHGGAHEFGEREELGERGAGKGGRRILDQHQKIRNFRQGDILAIPIGASHWVYNDGDRPIVAIVLLDTTNNLNQLDIYPRRFYLAGNPEQEHPSEGERGHHSQRPFSRHGGQGGGGEGGAACQNIFCGIDAEFMAEAFGVDLDLATRLQNENDKRNSIVKVEGRLQVLKPPRREREMERGSRRETEWESEKYGRRGGYNEEFGSNKGEEEDDEQTENGLEETLCTMRLKENLADPRGADVYTQNVGRINTVNSHNLPILFWLQLSAEHGLLQSDAMMVPHWNMNAHSIIYVIRGRARVQVVDNTGKAVFNEDLQEGRILVVPQSFAVIKRAEREEFEWVSFKTSDNAMINTAAGRNSYIRALPDEVVANAYQISREEARRLKYNRKGTSVFRPRSGKKGFERRAEA